MALNSRSARHLNSEAEVAGAWQRCCLVVVGSSTDNTSAAAAVANVFLTEHLLAAT